MLVAQLGNTICWGFHSEIVFWSSIEELITGFLLALTDFHSQSISRSRLQLGQHLDLLLALTDFHSQSISRSRLQLGQHLDLWFYFFKPRFLLVIFILILCLSRY